MASCYPCALGSGPATAIGSGSLGSRAAWSAFPGSMLSDVGQEKSVTVAGDGQFHKLSPGHSHHRACRSDTLGTRAPGRGPAPYGCTLRHPVSLVAASPRYGAGKSAPPPQWGCAGSHCCCTRIFCLLVKDWEVNKESLAGHYLAAGGTPGNPLTQCSGLHCRLSTPWTGYRQERRAFRNCPRS
jgi:hypothetical protein